jgi:hypothetical protein
LLEPQIIKVLSDEIDKEFINTVVLIFCFDTNTPLVLSKTSTTLVCVPRANRLQSFEGPAEVYDAEPV